MVLSQITLEILKTKSEFAILLEQIQAEFESLSRKLMFILQHFALPLWKENNIPLKDLLSLWGLLIEVDVNRRRYILIILRTEVNVSRYFWLCGDLLCKWNSCLVLQFITLCVGTKTLQKSCLKGIFCAWLGAMRDLCQHGTKTIRETTFVSLVGV